MGMAGGRDVFVSVCGDDDNAALVDDVTSGVDGVVSLVSDISCFLFTT